MNMDAARPSAMPTARINLSSILEATEEATIWELLHLDDGATFDMSNLELESDQWNAYEELLAKESSELPRL